MKRILILFGFILLATLQIQYHKYAIVKVVKSNWDIMYEAICAVESENDSLAYNSSSNAAGIIQLRPIYVKDVNRIQGTKYTLKDRYNPKKCREMFEIYQSYYNPEKDIEKAIRIHLNGCNNYNTNEWYLIRVVKAMDNFKKDSQSFYIFYE